MKKRAITLVAGLALVVAACGADVDPISETAQPDSTLAAQTTEGTSTTVTPATPQPPEDDYGVDPEAGETEAGETETTTTTVSEATPPPDGPVDAGGGKIVEPVPVEDSAPPIVGEAPASVMEAIMADLSGLTGAQPSAFTVIRAESVIWNDGSLGCAQPGVMYTQATVPGYWVVIDHAGTEYDYRTNDRGSFVRCVGGAPPSGNPNS